MTPYPMANLWLGATIALIVGHAFYMGSQRRLLYFDPLMTFWGGYMVCYILQPLSYSDIFVNWHSVELLDTSLFYAFLGVVCVVIGYEMELGKRLAIKIPHLTRTIDPDRLFKASLILTVMGMSAYYFLFQSAGGMWQWLSKGRGATDYASVSGYVNELEKLMPVGIYLLSIHVTIHPVSFLRRTFAWTLVALLWLWYLYLGSRSHIIAVAMLAGAAYYVPKQKNPSLLLLVPVFISLMVLTSFLAHYRDIFTNLSFHLNELNMEEAKEVCMPTFLGGNPALQHKDVNQGIDFNIFMSTVELAPSKVPYNYGWQFMEFLTRPIPRALWPNKIYPGVEAYQGVLREGGLSTAFLPDSDLVIGPAFTFAAFWYDILGPITLLLGGLYTGILFRTLRSYLDRDTLSDSTMVIYSTLLVIGFLESAATPFLWLFDIPLSTILPLAILAYICRQDRDEGFTVPPPSEEELA